MNATKAYTVLIVLATVLSIVGYTYAHWTDTIRINGSIKMAHTLVDIKSEKVLMSRDVQKYSSVTYEVSADRHTISIYSENLKPCWHIWIGLVIQNQGTLPGKVKPPEIVFEGLPILEDHFATTEYFYGPYPEETGFGSLEIWGKVVIGEHLKSDGNIAFTTPPTPTPFTLNPTEKAVVWIWIHCQSDIPDDAQGKTVTLKINIIDDIDI